MQKGAEYIVTPHAMAQGGDAVGRIDGLACFIPGALPGEEVKVKITQVNTSYVRAELLEIITPSADRVPVLHPGAPNMEWQHIDPVAQLQYKVEILHDQLVHIGKLADVPEIQKVIGSPAWQYRNNARLHGYGNYLGYRADGSKHVTEVTEDPLLQPALQQVVKALRAAVAAHPPEPRTNWSVVLRLSETTGDVVAAINDLPNRIAIQIRDAWVAACPNVIGVRMPWGAVDGAETVTELHFGVSLDLGATTFFQVSLGAARALCDTVLSGLGDITDQRIVDAYCGAGTFTLPLAMQCGRVIGIEEYAPAVANGQANAWNNKLENVEWFAESVEKGIMHVHNADAVVLDPPRKGCHPAVIQSLHRFKPTKIAYVSCHPGTLARDLGLIVAGGYRITAVSCVDCFPQTSHVESVVMLERVV